MTVTVLSIISMRTIFPRLLYLSIGGFLLLPHLCCNTAPVEETSSWCNPESTDISLYNQCTVFSHHTHTTLPSHKGEEVGSFRGTSPVADTASSILADHSEHISTSSITLADDSTLNPDFMPTLSVPPLLHHKQQQQQQLQQHQQEEQQQQQQLQQHQQEEQQQQQQLQQHQQERRLGLRGQSPNRDSSGVAAKYCSREFITQFVWYFVLQLLVTLLCLNLSKHLQLNTIMITWWGFNIAAAPILFSLQKPYRHSVKDDETARKILELQRDIEQEKERTTELNNIFLEAKCPHNHNPSNQTLLTEIGNVGGQIAELKTQFAIPPPYMDTEWGRSGTVIRIPTLYPTMTAPSAPPPPPSHSSGLPLTAPV
eukprot:GHVQ01011924.1.p1 GENE.GHVQ01011924.1~~GHVQ01011924.1.p1  ORF type:complete len:369 (+),score=73.76 GHVQ01011924.1:207-1313(+)